VDEDVGAGALDEPGSIVLVDGGLVSFPAGDAGELVLDQAGVLCAYTMARDSRERSKGRRAKGCARRGCGVRRGCHAGCCPLLLQRSRAGRGGRRRLTGWRWGGTGWRRSGAEGQPCDGTGQSAEGKAVQRRGALVQNCRYGARSPGGAARGSVGGGHLSALRRSQVGPPYGATF